MPEISPLQQTAENINKLQEALRDADQEAQMLEERTRALVAAIRTLLTEPDSGANRIRIETLASMIEDEVASAASSLNWTAEQLQSNHSDESTRAIHRAMHEAARAQPS